MLLTTPLKLRYFLQTEFASLNFRCFGVSMLPLSEVLLLSLTPTPITTRRSPKIAHNVSVYKYTSVYLNGKMYTEKKIYMFVCHCNQGAETCRIWFLATIGDHKQRTNLNNVWLSGQVQSHKYQALCVCFLWAKPWEFFGRVLCNFAHRTSILRYKIHVSCHIVTT